MATEPDYFFSPAEWGAIHVHKYYLSQQSGRRVSFKQAIDDWMDRYSKKWREKHREIVEMNGNNPERKPRFSPAEWKAIRVHRYFLSQRHSRYVSLDETIDDWMKNYTCIWREKRMELSSRNQMEQILRHKWLESEKVGHDLGSEAAADWIEKFAEKWRQWWESE